MFVIWPIQQRQDNNEQAQLNRFFEVWTLKECYIKMLGTGIYKALDSFSITPEGHTYKMIELDLNIYILH